VDCGAASRCNKTHSNFYAAWTWGIDTVIPMRAWETQGDGKDRKGCMTKFKAAGTASPATGLTWLSF
jgi:hypothetical protein